VLRQRPGGTDIYHCDAHGFIDALSDADCQQLDQEIPPRFAQGAAKALQLLAQADCATNSQMRAEFENLAAAFIRLAEQVDGDTKLVIEFLLPHEKTPTQN
jgi:hypothetical protein